MTMLSNYNINKLKKKIYDKERYKLRLSKEVELKQLINKPSSDGKEVKEASK